MSKLRKSVTYFDDVPSDEDVEPEFNFPDVTLYTGDYHGNLKALRLFPPMKKKSSFHDSEEENDDYLEIFREKGSNITPLTKFLAKKKGIDVSLLDGHKQLQYKFQLKPSASGQIHPGVIKSMSCNEKYLASGGVDETIKICLRKDNRITEFGELHRHSCSIISSCFSNDNQLLLTGGTDGNICVWRTNNWECISVFKGHTGDVNAISVHPTAPLAISLGKDNNLRVWNLKPEGLKLISANALKKVMPKWGSTPLPYFDIQWNPSGNGYAVASNRNIIICPAVGPSAGKPSCTIEDDDIKVLCIAYITDRHLAIGSETGKIYIADTETSQIITSFCGSHTARIRFLKSLNEESNNWLNEYFHIPKPIQDNCESASFHYLVSVCTEGRVSVWKLLRTGHLVEQIENQLETSKLSKDTPEDLSLEDMEDIEDEDVEIIEEIVDIESDEDADKITIQTTAKIQYSYKAEEICTATFDCRITAVTLSLPKSTNSTQKFRLNYNKIAATSDIGEYKFGLDSDQSDEEKKSFEAKKKRKIDEDKHNQAIEDRIAKKTKKDERRKLEEERRKKELTQEDKEREEKKKRLEEFNKVKDKGVRSFLKKLAPMLEKKKEAGDKRFADRSPGMGRKRLKDKTRSKPKDKNKRFGNKNSSKKFNSGGRGSNKSKFKR